jgi:two-component system capsular synthesis sensor histidine kinase RcsC
MPTVRSLRDARVLLIEDERVIREIMLRHFSAIGIKELDSYGTAEAAWEELMGAKGNRFDVLIVDLNLPGVGGQAMIKKLRSLPSPRAKTIPVIVMTGENNPNTYKQIEPLGITAYLIKPVSVDVLKAAVEKALGGHIARTAPSISPVIHEKPSRFGF